MIDIIHCTHQGVLALWNGAQPTVWRNGVNQATMFWCKNAVDEVLWEKRDGDGKALAVWQSMASGFIATCPGMYVCMERGQTALLWFDGDHLSTNLNDYQMHTTRVLTNPFDIVKTRCVPFFSSRPFLIAPIPLFHPT